MRPPTVLFYHQLVRRPRRGHYFFSLQPTPEQFQSDMQIVRRHYTPVTMDDMCRRWYAREPWSPRSVLVTFDDGFRNNLWAAEILRELGMSAVFFVLGDVIDSSFKPWYIKFAHILSTRQRSIANLPCGMADLSKTLKLRRWTTAAKEWMLSIPPVTRDEALAELSGQLGASAIDEHDEDYQYMGTADLRRMVELGMTVGCHTASHDNLTRCSAAELQREMVDCRRKLAEITGGPIDYLSYPDGRFNEQVLALAADHYRFAFAAAEHFRPDHAWRYPRRNAIGNVRKVLSRWFPLKRRCIQFITRILRA